MTAMRMSNVRIPVRIAIACLIPVLAFTAFALKDLFDKRAIYSKSEEMAALADASTTITSLIQELQGERLSSVAFVNSKGQSFGDQMRRQRPAVDAALAAWQQRMTEFTQAHAGSDFARDINAAKQKLASLAATRSGLDSMTLKPQEVYDFYSSTISLLATSIDEMG